MSGIRRQVVFRFVPANGPTLSVDTTTAFASARSVLMKAALTHYPLVEVIEDIERKQRPIDEGVRLGVEFEFVVVNMADHLIVAKIANWLRSTTGRAYIALDGATFREAFLSDYACEPLRDKIVAGFRITITAEVVDPISEIITMTSGVSPW